MANDSVYITCIESLIRKKLRDTKENCGFKKAFIPLGWACVEIETFARELVKELKKAGCFK